MGAALVTGSTAGIGSGFAQRLAATGWDLVLVARTADRLRRQADDLVHRYGGRVEVLPADLGDRQDCARVEERLADPAAPIHLLVNNAGFGTASSFANSDREQETRQLDVMCRAVLRLTHAAVTGPHGMVARGSGGVVNVSSVAGWVPGGSYAAAKAWVTSFSRGVAAELSGTGVHVVALCPGFTRTEFHQRAGSDVSAIPSWLWLTVDEVVAGALRDLEAGRSLSVPTARYQVLAALARHAPDPLVRAVYVRARPKR